MKRVYAHKELQNSVIGIWNVLELVEEKRVSRNMVWLCKCLVCGTGVKEITTHALTCKPPKSCGCLGGKSRKRPFEALYNKLKYGGRWSRRARPVLFSYDDFLKFTLEGSCHYCRVPVFWQRYNLLKHSAYNLDRKDNQLPYTMANCVVCCSRCNKAKSDKFTYEEWYGMTYYFRKSEISSNLEQS